MNSNQNEQNQTTAGGLDKTVSVVSYYLNEFHKKRPEILGRLTLEGMIKQNEYMLCCIKTHTNN